MYQAQTITYEKSAMHTLHDGLLFNHMPLL